jgi:hypothetical protein
VQTVTLSNLRGRVRKKLDAENALSPTDAQVDGAINNAVRRLHAKLAQYSEDDFTEAAILATVANQSYVELPNDFLALRSIEWLPDATAVLADILMEDGSAMLTEDGGAIALEEGEATFTGPDSSYTLDRFNLRERPRFTQQVGGWAYGRPAMYRLVGRSAGHVERAELAPIPTGVYTLRVWYIPAAATLSDDADTYDGRSGFDQWVVLEAAIDLATDEESDVRAWASERERIWADQIEPLFRARDRAQPRRVVDVERSINWWE